MGNAGSSQPTNRTGKKVVTQKIENAKKTGVLSLREHQLESIPPQVFEMTTLTTLDVSKNKLIVLGPKLAKLLSLKSVNCDDNRLVPGALEPLSGLSKLQNLSAGGNRLGKPISTEQDAVTKLQKLAIDKTTEKKAKQHHDPLPSKLPLSLKQLKLNANFLSSIPPVICTLTKLQKLDLSHNHLAAIPPEIALLTALNELKLNHNVLVALPEEMGRLSKLKSLSLENNQIRVHSKVFTKQNPQPLPASLFTDTPLIDLNLHGNPMTSTQLNEFEGYDTFLERRKKTNTKNLYGGAMANLDTCGLE